MRTKTLADIFAFGDGFGEQDWTKITRLARTIRQKVIMVERVTLPDLPYDAKAFSRFSGRTMAHMHLCAQAAAWLESTGRKRQTVGRLDYPGGVADVLSEDGTLAIECGYTTARKVLKALEQGTRVMVVPYNKHDPVIGYLFTGRLEPEREPDMAQAARQAARLRVVRWPDEVLPDVEKE